MLELSKDSSQGTLKMPEGSLVEILFSRRNLTMDIVHTFTPPEQRGKGQAAALVSEAYAIAQRAGYMVIPSCTYVKDTFLKQHPEWEPLTINESNL